MALRGLLGLLLVAALIVLPGDRGRAARPLETGPLTLDSRELVVFEIDGCAYCELFRQDILPGYLASPRSRTVPIRFVNAERVDLKRLPLASPVDTVPTVILVKNGREAGRITGYTGPENFFRLVSHLLGPID
jgi:hypothetical protein